MPVLYRGQRIVPGPLVAISKSHLRSGDDEKLGTGFTLTLTGTLLPHKGTPYTDGSSYTDPTADPADQNVTRRASGIMSKMAALRDLFSDDGKLFHIYACDLSDEQIACYPIVEDIAFNDGTWVNEADYQITLRTPFISGTLNGTTFSVYPSGEDTWMTPYIKSADETWTVETSEPENDVKLRQHSFRVTHNLSAVGQRVYFPSGSNHLHGIVSKEPWEWAKHWCESKLIANPVPVVFSSGMSSGIMNMASGYLTAYNHVRIFTSDKKAGAYSVNDTWVLSSGNSFEDFTVTVQSAITEGLTIVSVEGNVQGMETIDYLANNHHVSVSKWEAASGAFNTIQSNLYSRVSPYASNLNTIPLNTVIGRNPVGGTINYTYTYDNRPSNCITSPLVLSEVIDIETNNPTDVFSNIGVVGRTAGSLLQNLNTTTVQTKTLNIEVVMVPSGCQYGPPTNVIESINTYIAGVSGSLVGGQKFRSVDSENFSVKGGRYRRTIGWTIGQCG